jgi:light-regulated signal transduction histidine kinase (bacteriophytochrome)
MTVRTQALVAELSAALAEFGRVPDESALSRAYDLGRQAMNDGLGLAEIGRVFREAAQAVEPSGDAKRTSQSLTFLFELLAPYEMVLRGYREANDQLRALTSRLQAQNLELAQTTAAAQAANQELEAFAYSISHDLRAPVRHIQGFAELLLEQSRSALSATSLHHLTVIDQSAKRMAHMIEAMLGLSRIDRHDLTRTKVDMSRIVADVIRDLEPDLQNRVIEWHIDALPKIRCDGELIRLVFANLISNAVKYTRGRTPAVIEVGCAIAEREAVFSVRDNGAGFDSRYAHKLFGVFQRLHSADEFEGTGVGLATVSRIVRKHGGSTWAKGEAGVGATFYFTLPIEPE